MHIWRIKTILKALESGSALTQQPLDFYILWLSVTKCKCTNFMGSLVYVKWTDYVKYLAHKRTGMNCR